MTLKTSRELQIINLNKNLWHKDSSSQRPKMMGIINITPDSFSDGGCYVDTLIVLKRARELFNAGADIIDIGGQSTRPGSTILSAIDELDRLIPALNVLLQEFPSNLFY